PASIIQGCHKLVQPRGHVFFSPINRNPQSYLFAILGAEYILRMLAKGTQDYSKCIKPSELAHDIRNTDLMLKATTGQHYHPLTKGTHNYSKFIEPSELAHDNRNKGLKLKDMTGLHYNPLTKRYSLAPNVEVNYMVYTVKEAAEASPRKQFYLTWMAP